MFTAAHALKHAVPGRAEPDPTLFPHYIQNQHGLWLRFTEWWPRGTAPIRGVVFVVSGLNEHAGRYDSVALRFNTEGYVVFSMDNQGAGGSEGVRQYVERFSHFVDDLQHFIRTMDERHAELAEQPRVLLGHSMGGLIAILLAMRMPDYFSAVVLSGPGLAAGAAPGRFLRRVVALAARVTPKLPLGRLPLDSVSYNAPVRELMQQDPCMSGTKLRARFVDEMMQAQQYALGHAAEVSFPFLIVHGERDTVCLLDASRRFFDAAASTDKQLRTYDGGHEILTEVCRAQVMQDVLDFVDARCRIEKSTSTLSDGTVVALQTPERVHAG